MAILVVNGLRALFAALGCVMVATLIYTISIDGLPFRMDLLTPWINIIALITGTISIGLSITGTISIGFEWMGATLVDFYINIGALGAWICYKESNWIRSLLWLVLLVCLGSITTCAYILMQLFKLSPQEALEDPIYHVLLRHPNKDATERNKKCCRVVTARVIFSILGILMFGTLVFTIVTDGSPFRAELFTPWLTATLVDFYINIVALSVWVAYKEPRWLHAILWISLLICFGSAATCVYIVYQLHRLASQDPLYLVLLDSGDRAVNGYERSSETM